MLRAVLAFPHHFQPPSPPLSLVSTISLNSASLLDTHMTLVHSRRFLNNATDSSDFDDHADIGSDFFVILAALMCGTVCLLSLIAAARCAWVSLFSARFAGNTTSAPQPRANKGLKKKILQKIPKLTYTSSAEDATKFHDCAICLTEFVAGDVLRVLPQCSHGFHVACVDLWLKSHSSCPSCRQILVDTSQKSNEMMATANAAAGAENYHRPSVVW